ncbi:class I mannose-6-phosphate isomerase [Nocardiopsis kunsanensis]|uniref:class I mannose-6-phosphate isomerase n=1 Tax=Nocardiopsis kunsanensis TaxID=141693 RepID=UPI0003449F6F|nr:class I mannose-6-phosphate isomerase [Nocardiopsis kunsanensis]
MERRPLRLSAPVRPLVFGGRSIGRKLGREGLPDWAVAETWEVSDVEGNGSVVIGGPLAGRSLRSLVEEFPQELMGRGWRGAFFPLLTKFIDAEGALPVHLHPDDATAARVENQAVGKTEAWHILQADPGATALCGVREGVGRDQLHKALVAQDFDSVLRRLPVRAGETIYVPGGTLHSFGPRTLVHEIEQTSDLQQHAMRWNMEDGSPVDDQQWRSNLEALMAEVRLDSRPDFHTGLRIGVGDGVDRVFCCAGPHFALERWRAGTAEPLRRSFSTAQILTNVGPPVQVSAHGRSEELGRGRSLLLPAVMEQVRIPGPADVLFGYLPDLALDVREPLTAAGYSPELIASLGEGV